MASKVISKMSSKQKTQNIEKNSFFKRIGRKCTKYNFVAPLSFTDCYSLGLDQKFAAVPTWNSKKIFPSETLSKVSA